MKLIYPLDRNLNNITTGVTIHLGIYDVYWMLIK